MIWVGAYALRPVRHCIDAAMECLELSAEPWHAAIDPALGASILSLSCAGHSVLRAATSAGLAAIGVRATGCYPLVPYANRIGSGRLRLAERDYALRANFPPEPHALHGIGWQRPWQTKARGPTSAELVLDYAADDPMAWPFAFQARLRFVLGARGLQIALSVENRDRETWPAGIGLHPNFALWPGQTLQFDSGGAWANGPDMLPQRPLERAQSDFSAPRQVAGLRLDNDFYHWRGRARLAGGPVGPIRLTATEAFSVLRVFTPTGRDFIGIEPVSHIADAVHRPQAVGSGYHELAPGQVLSGTVCIELETRT